MSVSPMMQQYLDAKQAAGDALLLFRMGDFYELFFEDAKQAAKLVGLTLTSRDKGENPVPMAGFPYHQLDGYLAKLIALGQRVAVCEQIEDPKQAKGIVKRDLTRIVTPGTLTDDALLDPRGNNFLAAVVPAEESPAARNGKQPHSPQVGLAWVELSTGQFQAATLPAARLADELARIQPAECLLPDGEVPLAGRLGERILVTRRPAWAFGHLTAVEQLTKQFGTKTLEGFGFGDQDAPGIRAAGALLDYLNETQRTSLGHLDRLERYAAESTLQLDESTRRSLELTRTIREGRREGTLLDAIDHTVSPMGARLFGDWLANPLAQREPIELRQAAIAEFVANPALVEEIREHLKGVYDLERLLARVTTLRASPRDLAYVARTLHGLPKLKARLAERESRLLTRLETDLDLCPEIRAKLDAALQDDCPLSPRDGGFIRNGYRPELDALRDLAAGGKQWIAKYQADQVAATGIANLKVGYNKVFGYYLEITNSHGHKVPDSYIRKQTVKNAERYITPELKQYEEQVLTADERAKELEHQLFVELRDFVAAQVRRLHATARILAELDVLAALSHLARQRNYCRPTMVDDPILGIDDGRHPVLDTTLPAGTFVPNDAHLDEEHGKHLLITGPNMAGKSTYIRQVALIVLLAHLGSWVPARKAIIGVTDRIFARVGASDELSRGQSTFMVEMTETARILNTATAKSLVILDEIGRGTSTYDGISLAWSVVEYLQRQIGCRLLFATHYHELTDLATSLPGVKNLNVAVREWDDQVVFLHKIVPGAADKSYGIHVARLAGVPSEVNERAKQILAQLESEHLDAEGRPKIAANRVKIRPRRDLQLTLFAPEQHPLLDEIRALDLNGTTPLAALKLVEAWQSRLQAEKKSEQ